MHAYLNVYVFIFLFVKQKTAYEMRISDWSSDVCSSDLQYIAAIPEVERHDLISAFHRRLTSEDEPTRLAAARAWSVWEGATSFLHVDPAFVAGHEDAAFALAFARIENHYFVNGGFFEVDDQLLRDAHRIADIPGVIVHGRYAVV